MTKRAWTGLVGAVVLGVGLSGCGLFASKPTATVLATVNGQNITNTGWREAIDGLGVLNGQKLPTDTADKKSQVKQLMIWSAVEQWTLSHHVITQKKASTEAASLMKQLETSAGGKKTLTSDLKTYGMTLPQFEDFLTTQQILQAAFKKATAKVKAPTAAAEQKYYKQNQGQFITPQSDEVQVILVKTANEAASLETQLKAGASFATLAKKDSLDPSASQGGELGNVPVSTSSGLPTNFLNVMSGLKAGQYGIASTSSGYYLMQVQKVTAPSQQTFSQVKSTIQSTLESNSKNQAFQKWGTQIEKGYKTQFLMK